MWQLAHWLHRILSVSVTNLPFWWQTFVNLITFQRFSFLFAAAEQSSNRMENFFSKRWNEIVKRKKIKGLTVIRRTFPHKESNYGLSSVIFTFISSHLNDSSAEKFVLLWWDSLFCKNKANFLSQKPWKVHFWDIFWVKSTFMWNL